MHLVKRMSIPMLISWLSNRSKAIIRKSAEILNQKAIIRKSAEILNQIDPRFPIDLIVRTPEQVRERQKNNDFIIKEIMEKGIVLYEAHNP